MANSRWLELTMETGNFLVDFFLNIFIKISVILVYAYFKKYDAPWEERHYGNKKTTWRIFNAPSLYQGEGKDTA